MVFCATRQAKTGPLLRRKALRAVLWCSFQSILSLVENSFALSVSGVRGADVISRFTHGLELIQLADFRTSAQPCRAVQMLMNGGAGKIKAAHDGLESL